MLSVALLLATAGSAAAHARVVATQPVTGTAVATPPKEVTVTFDSTVRVGPGNAVIRNGGGSVLAGTPHIRTSRTLVLPLRDGLADGVYTARWSVISDDGHEEQGVIAFGVGKSGPPVTGLSVQSTLNWHQIVKRAVFLFGALVAIGAALFSLLILRPLRLDGRRAQLLVLAAGFAIAFAGGLALSRTPGATGTRFGEAVTAGWIVAAVGAVAAGAAIAVPALRYAAWSAAAALFVCPTLSGHALDAGQPNVIAPLIDLAHVAGAATWVGGLASLAFAVAAVAPELRTRVITGFSKLALFAVVLIALGGLGRALTEFSAVSQLWTTGYGRAIVIKSVLFAVLLVVGLVNRSRLLSSFARLRQSLLFELVVIAGIVLAVGALTDLKPGSVSESVGAQIGAQPPLPPPNAYTDAGQAGAIAVGLAVVHNTATVTLLSSDGTAPIGVPVTIDGQPGTDCGPGCFSRGFAGPAIDVTAGAHRLRFVVPASPAPAPGLLRRATKAYTSLTTLTVLEQIESTPGFVEISRIHAVAPTRLATEIIGGSASVRSLVGTASVVIGPVRWDRNPGKPWVRSRQIPVLEQPNPWWSTLSRNAYVVGESNGLTELSFFDPTIPAWFHLWVRTTSFEPVRLKMVAAAHFMTDAYSGANRPFTVKPPS